MANPDTEHAKAQENDSFFGSYEAHAKTLRGWLILYGAALPAYFLKEKTFADLIRDSGHGRLIIMLFLLGILLQVIQVFTYKVAMGYLYLEETLKDERKTKFKATYRYRLSSWYSDQTWPVVILDLGTIALYGCATWMLLTAFLTPSPITSLPPPPAIVAPAAQSVAPPTPK
jgi:hypothetical protein